MVNLLERADYALRQGVRVAWYTGHYFAIRRTQAKAARAGGVKPVIAPLPPQSELMKDMGALFSRDLANANEGIYPLPFDHDGRLQEIIASSLRFFRDLPAVERRRADNDGVQGFKENQDPALPRYYQQNFHYQTDGYLSDHSARLYDIQVEILFTGSANVMRRQALVPVHEFIQGQDQRMLNMCDLACGTGRFLRFVRQAYPKLNLTGIDLSNAYLDEAERHLKGLRAVDLLCANAEQTPLKAGSQDIVTAIFLFHELPPKVRAKVAGEIARILQPGGRFIFVDSLQRGDKSAYDGLLEFFQNGFYEPYFSTYLGEDFETLFAQHGLRPISETRAFLSKVVTYERV